MKFNLITTVKRVNITTLTKAIRKTFASTCVQQDVPIFMKVSGIPLWNYFASDQKWISCTTLAHLVAEKCVIPRKMLNS